MKKLMSALMSAALAVVCLTAAVPLAYANTKKTADVITLNGVTNAYVDASNKYWVEFEPTVTDYYEFVCYTQTYDSTVFASIYDSDDEVYMQTLGDASNPNVLTAAELTAGDTYYFVLETAGNPFSSAVTVRHHDHIYNVTQSYAAVYDPNDASLCDDGGLYTFFAYCSSSYANAVYYYPTSISLKTKTFTYNGKAKKTTVTVYDRLGNIIPSDQYSVSYKNNKKPGYSTVTVKMKGNYQGTFTAKMTIKPKKATLKSAKSTKKKKITLKWKKDSTVTGYQIQYSTSKKFASKKTKTVTIKKKSTTSKTISKLKSKKKYYVRIRAYKQSGGKKIYGAWTKTKTVKVK